MKSSLGSIIESVMPGETIKLCACIGKMVCILNALEKITIYVTNGTTKPMYTIMDGTRIIQPNSDIFSNGDMNIL